MNAPAPFWQQLFAPEDSTHPLTTVTMQLLTKRGTPLLLVPKEPHLATSGLELYPAQTARSRLMRSLAGWALQARLPLGVKSVGVRLSPGDPFVEWLARLAHIAPGGVPQFAGLAGNPNSPGQRLILMLFDPEDRPTAVVKAGVTNAARKLIEQEHEFLANVPKGTPGVPSLRGTFNRTKLRAMALDFLPGRSPCESDEQMLPQVLGNWLRPQQPTVFTAARVWQDLAATSAEHPVFKSLTISLRNQSGAGAMAHGDFAPWNVRVAPSGAWMALDWERGDLYGLPTWDWFHYIVQKCILVQRQPVAAIANSIAALLASNEFKAYAQTAGIIGSERALVLAYLLHQAVVIRPSEGLVATRDLLNELAARWR